MNQGLIPTEQMLTRLAAGLETHSSLSEAFLHAWVQRFGPVALINTGPSWLDSLADLGEVRLRGTEDLHCCLDSGDGSATRLEIRNFPLHTCPLGRLLFILAASTDAGSAVRSILQPVGPCLVLSPIELCGLLVENTSKPFLPFRIRSAIPLLELIRYDVSVSAERAIHYARGDKSAPLREQVDLHFVIDGSSTIGKPSLVKYHHQGLIRHRPGAATVYVHFYECADHSMYSTRHFFAINVDGSTRRTCLQPADPSNLMPPRTVNTTSATRHYTTMPRTHGIFRPRFGLRKETDPPATAAPSET